LSLPGRLARQASDGPLIVGTATIGFLDLIAQIGSSGRSAQIPFGVPPPALKGISYGVDTRGDVTLAPLGAQEGDSAGVNGAICSFDPDTQVVMADGTSKPIKDIRVGDRVEAGDPSTGRDEGGRAVTALHDHQDQDLVDVTMAGRDGKPHTIHTTTRHPFWDDTTRAWVPAGELAIGHDLRTVDGHDLPITALVTLTARSEMINLTVDGLHTFYVRSGTEAVLVHNTCNGFSGTNMSDEESFNYHYGRHGKPEGVSPEQYASDAKAWKANPAGSPADVPLADGSTGSRYRTPGGGPGGILDSNGNIVTFWYH
jgi:hypothetical protein